MVYTSKKKSLFILLMIRGGGVLLILGHFVKSLGKLGTLLVKQYEHYKGYSFLSNHFLSIHKVKDQCLLWHKSFKPCGQATEYNLCPSLKSHA